MELNRLKELAGILNEAKDYNDSSEFTEDYIDVMENLLKIYKIVKTEKWKNWVKVTEQNYDVKTIDTFNKFYDDFKRAFLKFEDFKKEIDKADIG